MSSRADKNLIPLENRHAPFVEGNFLKFVLLFRFVYLLSVTRNIYLFWEHFPQIIYATPSLNIPNNNSIISYAFITKCCETCYMHCLLGRISKRVKTSSLVLVLSAQWCTVSLHVHSCERPVF